MFNTKDLCILRIEYGSPWSIRLSDGSAAADGSVQLETAGKLKEPEMYRVLLHNDHYTTMDFVIEVLMTVFHMTNARATQVMLDVHKKGIGVCGVFTYDIAVTKVEQVHLMARSKQFPLRCSFEKA